MLNQVPICCLAVPVDSDLSSEGLESHHMVLVMVVMHTCSHLRRLRLDGNKVCPEFHLFVNSIYGHMILLRVPALELV